MNPPPPTKPPSANTANVQVAPNVTVAPSATVKPSMQLKAVNSAVTATTGVPAKSPVNAVSSPVKPPALPKLGKPPEQRTSASTKSFAVVANKTSGVGRKIVTYGAAGSGKTSLACLAPQPVFIDLEGSTVGLNVNLIPGVDNFDDLREAARQAINLVPEGGTLVVDTISKVDEFIVDYLIKGHGKQSIKQLGYDRFPSAVEAFRLFLSDLDPFIRSGRNVVLNAHTAIISYKNATGDDYRQEGPKLAHSANDSCREQLNAWADFIFTIKYEDMNVTDTQAVGEKGKERKVGKIVGGNSNRVIYTTGTASLIAKSRPISGRHLPPIVSFSGPEDSSLWMMLLNPELIPQETT